MLTARRMLEMATLDGAHVAGVADRTGSLTPGKQADVVVIDGRAVNMAPLFDPVAAVVLCADVSNVRDVFVAGAAKKRDHKLLADVAGAVRGVENSRDHLVSKVTRQERWTAVPAS